MFRTSAFPRRGSLFRNQNVQQPQQQQVEEEQECCPICFETLAKETIGGRFLRSSSSAVQGTAKKKKVWCDCGHYFCQECISLYVDASIHEAKASGGSLRCPIDQCAVPMQGQLIRKLASPANWDKHLRFVNARIVNQDPLLRWCPKPGCNGVARLTIAPRTLQEAQKYLRVICDSRHCGHAFCANCGCAPHPGSRCDKADDKDYFAWKKEKGAENIKACPQCYLDTEKSGGCPAMLCTRCHAVWCWNCHKTSATSYIGPGQCNCNFFALAHTDRAPALNTFADVLVLLDSLSVGVAAGAMLSIVILSLDGDDFLSGLYTLVKYILMLVTFLVLRILAYRHIIPLMPRFFAWVRNMSKGD